MCFSRHEQADDKSKKSQDRTEDLYDEDLDKSRALISVCLPLQ